MSSEVGEWLSRSEAGEGWGAIARGTGLAWQTVKARVAEYQSQRADRAFVGADDWRSYLGTTLKTQELSLDARPQSGRRRVSVLADLHGRPSKRVVDAVCALDLDHIILAGDLLDEAQASPHGVQPGTSERRMSLRCEMAAVRGAIEHLVCSTGAVVHVMRGNHDAWAARKAADLLPCELLEFFSDPFDLLLADLPAARVKRVRTVFDYFYGDGSSSPLGETEYLMQFGDALISHANFLGRYPGDAVRALSSWADQWRSSFYWDPRLLIQAHVHKMSFAEVGSSGRVLVEPGAAFEPAAECYRVGYKVKGFPGSVGACYFEQVRRGRAGWVTDLGSVRLIRPARG